MNDLKIVDNSEFNRTERSVNKRESFHPFKRATLMLDI